MKVTKLLLTGMLVTLCGLSHGQGQQYRLSLEEARKYAMEHNRSLMNSRDGVINTSMIVKENIARGLPQVEGSVDYMTYFNYEMDLNFGGSGSDPNINYSVLDLGDLEILSALGQMFGSSEPIVMNDQLSGKLQVSQLIFSGQYVAGIQTARIARKLAGQKLEADELDVKENITNSYLQILLSEHTLRIIGRNLENLNEILHHTTNMFNAGLSEETDVDQLKVTVSQLKNTQKSLERMNRLNYNMLKFQLGVPPETNLVLTDSLPKLLDALDPGIMLEKGFDVRENINYQMVQSQVQMSQKQLTMSSWSYAPTIAGFYNYTGKILKTEFDLNPNHLAGISMSIPIFSSGVRKAQLSQAKISYDIAKRNLEMVNDQLELLKTQLLYVYQNALENYETQKENVTVAGRVLQSITNKYQQGAASSLDLTLANSNYLTAESNYLSSVLTLLQAQTSLDKLYNKL